MNAVKFNKVTAGYHDAPILKDLSFEVPEGSMTAVIGPNGSGKTTLLRAATGILTPFAGTVDLFGRDISGLPAIERARLIGVVPQSVETPMAFTVSEIVMIGRTAALPRWRHPSKDDLALTERAMVFTDVVDMKDRLFSELSAGERQRAVIAMVLAQEPRVLLMDEATSHLDINHRLEVMQIVERLNKEHNTTVIMVSHDLNLAAEFCETLLLLNNGELVSSGSAESVLNEATLRDVYHCDIHVGTNSSTGATTVSPSPRLTTGLSGHGIKVHVIAGGGSGEETLRRLSLCNYTVTCGVLNELDTDAEVAKALGIETVLEKPFSPISSIRLESAQQLADDADVVVVCRVPFGPGNLINLTLARTALDAGKIVVTMEDAESRDYTEGKTASSEIADLIDKGAKTWNNITDLLRILPTNTQETQ
jgi:iron complex transport system ATP-binding protein